jgi:hypothetical protein
MPCIIAGGEFLGLINKGGGTQSGISGEQGREKAGGEHPNLLRAAGGLYGQNALEAKKHNPKTLRLFAVLMLVFLLVLRRFFLYEVKKFFCYIFNFVHYLKISLLLSGQAPPFTVS